MLQRLIGHHRPKIGAADADIDDVAHALAGVAHPAAVADALGKVRHPGEHRLNLGHDVLAIHDDGGSRRRAKGHMQGRPVFGLVDLLAPEHGIDAGAQARLLREAGQQIERFAGDTVLRVIQEDARGLGGQPPAAFRIAREEGSQRYVAHLPLMIFQGLPCRGFASRSHSRGLHSGVSYLSSPVADTFILRQVRLPWGSAISHS